MLAGEASALATEALPSLSIDFTVVDSAGEDAEICILLFCCVFLAAVTLKHRSFCP